MSTAIRKKNAIDINIPVIGYSKAFDIEIEEVKMAAALGVKKTSMEFYLDDSSNGQYLLTITVPNNELATPDEANESIPVFSEEDTKKAFFRHSRKLLETSPYLFANSKKKINLELV